MQKRGGWDSAQLKDTGEARQSAIRITHFGHSVGINRKSGCGLYIS